MNPLSHRLTVGAMVATGVNTGAGFSLILTIMPTWDDGKIGTLMVRRYHCE